MDQQRRMVMFLTLSFGVTFLWLKIGLPFFYPQYLEQQARKKIAAPLDPSAPATADGAAGSEKAGLGATPEKGATDQSSENGAVAANGEPAKNPDAAAPAPPEIPLFKRRSVTIGTLQTNENTFLEVELTSRGASVSRLRLNDPRYRELNNRSEPLQLLGSVANRSQTSFDMRVNAIDELLKAENLSLEQVDWEVDEESLTDRQVTFRYPSPDGTLEILKTYTLQVGDPTQRDNDTAGYCLDVTLGFRNLSGAARSVEYELQGPVGMPLEEADNTRRFLMLQAGFVGSGSVRAEQLSAQEIAQETQKRGQPEALRSPVRYVGIDGQFFAALLVPKEDQATTEWLDATQPLLMEQAKEVSHSLISLKLISNPLELPPVAAESTDLSASQTWTLYAGPKRSSLLRPFDADSIIDYGWFGAICKIMLGIMNFFHRQLHLPYGLAIIMLTVIVRGAMYPISRKHALAAKKMKEMQPRFEEIRKKYENDKEKLAKAQMELMKESGFFSGCLPMLLQLPIFIALYQALSVSVDLRMAEFLWIDNLAAPDRLFQMPFNIPFLGNDFNLLPMLTVGLFVVQQKLFAPPPANEEQALQQKMMSYMMIFIGVMFYHVPAGLCVYFIASSCWAIAERKILDFHDTATDPTQKKAEPVVKPALAGKTEPADPKKPGWLQNVIANLDAAANPSGKGGKGKNTTTIKNKPSGSKS